jgi:hypothetical protein
MIDLADYSAIFQPIIRLVGQSHTRPISDNNAITFRWRRAGARVRITEDREQLLSFIWRGWRWRSICNNNEISLLFYQLQTYSYRVPVTIH